ncbi:MAG TPA: SCO family protein [Solirubrobacteraceae bacterium]|nr:SCO family protein [Solirubrobacteraceae bacterium]
MRPPLRLILPALTTLVVLAFALAVSLGGSSGARSPSSAFEGSLEPAGVQAPDFTLTDQNGRRTALHDYRGRTVLLTFLYSTCKDTCPLIAQQIRGALDNLGYDVPTLALSVDPAADTAANVRRFLRNASLTGRMRYLTGTRAHLAPLWHAYGVLPESAGNEASDHSAYVLLIDRHGVERVSFPVEELTPEGLAHDISKLRSTS